jgi:hypothetical protein
MNRRTDSSLYATASREKTSRRFFLDRVHTRDQTWNYQTPIHGVEIEEFPKLKKPSMSVSQDQNILICFVDVRFISHFEVIAETTIAIQTLYMEVLIMLVDAVKGQTRIF